MNADEQPKSWAKAFAARAAAYWTADRTRHLLGDKHLLLPPAEAGPLLRALGLLKGDASMAPDSVRKYLQVNHMVALLEPLLGDLIQTSPLVRILEVGCGRSYLALLLAWCFRHRYHHPVQVLGVDRNASLIETCRQRVSMVDLDNTVRFTATAAESLDVDATWRQSYGETAAELQVHALVALHACDTATDDALALGVRLDAQLIAAAPCCHAELARKWSKLASAGAVGALSPIWSSPHLRREAAATMTDALRTLLLRGCGYVVTPMEFVPATHTPKNTLLRAVRHAGPDLAAMRQYVALRQSLGGAGIVLERLLPERDRATLRQVEATSDG